MTLSTVGISRILQQNLDKLWQNPSQYHLRSLKDFLVEQTILMSRLTGSHQLNLVLQ